MKNSFKRVLGMVLAVGVAGSTLCAPARIFAADADGGFSDDFESYTAAELVTGKETSVTNDVWKMSSVYCGWDNGGGSALLEADANKYLELHGCGTWDTVLADFATDCSVLGPDVEMKIDYKREFTDSEGGIRFMVSGDENSFYELYTGRWGGIFKLRKVTNGTEVWAQDLTTFNVTADVWYSLSLANDGDTLLWSVTNLSDNTVENGIIVDEEMFETRGGAAKYQVSITGDSNAYYDNFSLKNIETSAENYESQRLIAADSFESYDVMDAEQNAEVETVGTNWQSSATYRGSGWMSNYMKSQLVDFEGSKMLKLAGYGGYYPEDSGCFNYIGDLSGIQSDVKMSVDMKFAADMGYNYYGGVRFIAHNNDKNYYGLYTGTSSDGTFGTWFVKVKDGTAAYSVQVEGVDISHFNTYKMEKKGNVIKYSVIDKTSKSVAVSGEYIDSEPFNPAKLDETYQLMIWHGATAYFDNFRLTSPPEYYVNGIEPDSVLYRDIASEAVKEHNSEYKYESYTFDSPKTIRRIIADGLNTEQVISVYLASSPDAVDWVKLGELSADANILNTTSTQTESCVIFSNDAMDSDFTIDKVRILSDELESSYTLKNEETVALYPRLGGVDCFDAWTVDDSNKVAFENGVFRAVGFGETTATAANGVESFTVKFNANPPESALYKEDFAEYTVMDAYLQGAYQTAGDWTTSGVYKGWNDGVKIQTVSAETNVMGFCGTNNSVGAIVHKLPTVQQDKPFIFKADLKSSHWANQSGAIRFCVSEDERTYYELIIDGMGSATPTFRKVVDESAVTASVNTASSTLGCDFSTTWLTLEMQLTGNTITYSVKNSSDNSVLWEGTYTDNEPLAPAEKISLTGSGDYLMYADNITAGSIDEFIDLQAEPETIMYVDAAARKPVYSSNKDAGKLVDRNVTEAYSFDGNDVVIDMMGGYIIRRIKASDAVGTIDCYVSNDNNTWYYLMPITAEYGAADVLNTLTANSYRYIKLASSDAAASEINVLAEPTDAAVRLNSRLYLAAHIDAADIDAADVAWSSADVDSAAVNDGVVTPVQKTTVPITVTATDMGSSASLSISVIDSSSFTDNGDGTVTAELGCAYYTDSASFIAAGYNADGILTNAEIAEPGCVNTGVDSISLTFGVGADANKIRLFCWDNGMTKMQPLCNAEEYNIN